VITEVTPKDDKTVDITWNSRPGAFYSVSVSTDLRNWTEVIDGFASQGDSTTFNYTGGPGLPDPDREVNSKLFLRVSEDQ
jgi:hypothetical protein